MEAQAIDRFTPGFTRDSPAKADGIKASGRDDT
jgi:hypothetical protein